MEVSFEDWLQAQIAREDLVGKIARSWFEFGLQEPLGQMSFSSWWDSEGVIKYHEEDRHLAMREYGEALKDLKAGISPESFPSALADKEIVEALDKCGDWHLNNPDITSAEYLWMRHRDLREFIKSQTTLYLDTGYWVWPPPEKMVHVE